MITIMQGTKLLTDSEALENLAGYIAHNIGAQDWHNHILNIAGYVGAMLNRDEHEVIGYLTEALKF